MLEELAKTPIIEVERREPVRVKPDAKLIDVVTVIREHKRGAVVIEDDDGKLAGMFTETDLVQRVAHDTQKWQDSPVGEMMTREPKHLLASASIAEALALMQQHTFRNIPIVNEHAHVVGIISIRDILAHLAEHFPEEFINLPPSSKHEASGRWGG